jgi:serine/threonine-protein kinase
MPTCPNCGGTLGVDDVFCANCGASIAPQADQDTQPIEEADSWDLVQGQLQEATRGRFAIERELGVGGMAAVYLAHEIALDRKVAIKVMSPGILMEKGMLDRFKQEAVTIAALKHPNIITVHSVEHHGQLHFFVLDYVDGGSLADVVERCGQLPASVAAAWFAQVGEALDYAHRRGVIHRDIKPANILLDSDGNAVVTDFGIAKVTEKRGLTMTGMTMGTPAYMSPEQCFGNPVTGSSDQYSLGIVTYETLAGQTPFQGSALVQMRAHTEETPRPIGEIRRDCPPELATAIHRMLEKMSADRWPSMADAVAASGTTPPSLNDPVRREMAALATGASSVSQVAAATPETPTPGWSAGPSATITGLRRHLKKIVTAGAAAVAATITILIAPWQQREPEGRPRPVAASLSITPQPGVLIEGETIQLQAALRDSGGTTIAGEDVVWSSDNDAVVTVQDGLLNAIAEGTATILAMGAGVTSTLDIVVEPGIDAQQVNPRADRAAPATVARVTVSPNAISLSVGQSQSLSAAPLDSRGRRVGSRPVRWSSSNPQTATVSTDGEVVARSPGTTSIVATVDGIRGTASVTVEAEAVGLVTVTPSNLELDEGQTAGLTAVVSSATGTGLSNRVVVWRSSNPSVVSISDQGTVTALAAGSSVISATSGGQVGQAQVTVVRAVAAVDEATARAQISAWIERFVTDLSQALRAKDLNAVRRAYGVPLPADDEEEWQTRFALDGNWQGRPAETFPIELFGDTWVVDFHVEIEFQGGGRSSSIRQRFRAGFKAGASGLELDRLRMQIG